MDTGVDSLEGLMGAGLRCAQRRDGGAAAARGGRRAVIAVCAAAGLAAFARGQTAGAPKPRPAWNVEGADSRMVVERAEDDFFLARLPARLGDRAVAAVRVFFSSNEVPSRVVWTDASGVTLLVDARAAKRGQPVKIYPLPGEAPAAAGPSPVVDPAPLRGCARRTAGMDFPATLDAVKTLETRCDGKPAWFAVSDAGKLPGTFAEWYRGDWTRKSHIVDLQTWLVVPADGNYLFGLAGVAPAWLLVDGRPALTHPAGQPYDKWTSGKEVPLTAGLRRIEVRTVCRQEIDTGVAWKRAGEPGVATNMVMLTGGDLREGRWETLGRRVHPFATAKSGAAYRFEGVDEVFVPFTFKDGSVCWGTNHTARWTVERGAGREELGAGAEVAAVLRKSQLPAAVRLTAAAATGEEAVCEVAAAYDGPVWSESEISSRLTGVPAVCADDERVHPIIRVRTSAADGLAYELAWEAEWASGARSNRVDALVTDKGWARVHLDGMEAGRVTRVAWSLRHQGVEVSKGATRFLREPFDLLPDAVSGETLKAGDEFVVMVISKASRGEVDAARGAQGTNGVVLLDGIGIGSGNGSETGTGTGTETGSGTGTVTGTGAAPLPDGGTRYARVVDIQAVEQDEAASGMSLLLPLAGLKDVMPASAAVLAPSLLGISREGGAGGFERRLSAMTGLLTGAACGKPRVVLVVPPAFDVLPGCGCVPGAAPCAHAAEARAYAEIVMRVADVYGVETVDLFSAFQIAGASDPLVENGGLTDAGRAFAEVLIWKKLGDAR